MRNLTHGVSLRRARHGLLVLCGLVAGLSGVPATAASYYEDSPTFHHGTGAARFGGGSVDVATGAVMISATLGSIKSPARVPIPGGFVFVSQDGT